MTYADTIILTEPIAGFVLVGADGLTDAERTKIATISAREQGRSKRSSDLIDAWLSRKSAA